MKDTKIFDVLPESLEEHRCSCTDEDTDPDDWPSVDIVPESMDYDIFGLEILVYADYKCEKCGRKVQYTMTYEFSDDIIYEEE